MFFPALLCTFGVTLVAAIEDPFFRRDYSYVNQFDAFYKLHWSQNGANWISAFFACQDEESSLFYPKEEGEWAVAKSLLTRRPTPNVSDILVGIHDEFGFGMFTTVDGSPFSCEIENNQSTIDGPACTTMNMDSGSFKAVKCDTLNLPFVCKKQYTIERCPTVDTGYIYKKETRKCYKFHENMKTWSNAMQTCILEGGSLLLIKTSAEAAFIRDQLSASNKDYFVGFRKLPPSGELYTVGGHRFDDTYYKNWYSNKRDCGNVYRSPDDITVLYTQTIDCYALKAFVCEMVPKTFSWRNWVNQGTEPQASMTNCGALEAEPAISVSVTETSSEAPPSALGSGRSCPPSATSTRRPPPPPNARGVLSIYEGWGQVERD